MTAAEPHPFTPEDEALLRGLARALPTAQASWPRFTGKVWMRF